MAAMVATTLADTMVAVATMLVAIQWYHAALYIISCVCIISEGPLMYVMTCLEILCS